MSKCLLQKGIDLFMQIKENSYQLMFFHLIKEHLIIGLLSPKHLDSIDLDEGVSYLSGTTQTCLLNPQTASVFIPISSQW